ncbi:MAG: hemagglutinin protein [Flavobacteriales bacterium]|nr:MAG: hemagglutinin protein [Flavobacteriales bacterium]
MRTTILSFALIASPLLSAQSISPSVIGSAGGTGIVGTTTLSWTIGETAVSTLDNGSNILTLGFHQGDPVRLKVNIRAFLQGPYNSGNGLMDDGLRANSLIPTQEPYTALGYVFVGGGNESTTQPIIDFPGTNAIIDWVVLELRDKNDNTSILQSRAALLQADGDVVDVDGFSAVSISVPSDSYTIAVLHRNHLGVMSAAPIALTGTAVSVDFTDGSTPTYGTEAQVVMGATHLLWSGDVNGDGVIKYTGANNDRDPILVAIGGTVPTNVVSGYLPSDVNMDGSVKYTGAGNDRDPILVNVGGTVPTNVRVGQMP